MTTIIILLALLILFTINSSLSSEEFRTYTFTELFAKEADDKCTQTISMYEDWIFAGQFVYNPEDVVNEHCNMYTLEIYANYPENLEALNIMFRVQNNGSGEHIGQDNLSFALHVSDGNQINESVEMSKNCSQTYGTYVTSDDVLKIDFPPKMPGSWFVIFTAFHTGLCHSYEYMCANKRCIFHSLSCNGFDPCGDQSDCNISPAAYATIALGGFCAVGVLVLIIYMFIKSQKMSDWSSRGRQPRKFSPAKALQSVQSFTPATVSITPIQRRWSYKY